MEPVDVLLIGYENQENLGLRSLISYLHSKKFTAVLIPFYPGQENKILKIIKKENPRVVGFSLIFQYTLGYFGKLISHLRANGIKCHFTAGGHFPSLEPRLTFEIIPELNSIVRFEGELTLVDLLNNLNDPDQWHSIPGLAFKRNSAIMINPARPLIEDLDSLPYVFRDKSFERFAGIKIAYMLASRGCLHNCSFCSIRQFYGSPEGPLRRTRSPQSVVAEMQELYNRFNVRFFSFQDDDFANRSPKQKKWILSFLDELKRKRLGDKIRWKISCRVDDIEADSLKMMKEQGLITVYLGVESGNMTGLKTMNKGVTPEQNLQAIKLLKRYDMSISIGFMLFDPFSTIETIRENLNFLRTIGSDGYFPVNFCKMLPYAGTPIEKQLRKTNRLLGTVIQSDYNFLNPLLNWYFYLVQKIFTRRNFHDDGLHKVLQDAEFEYRLACSFHREICNNGFGKELSILIAKSNLHAIETLEKLLDLILSKDMGQFLKKEDELLELANQEWDAEFAAEAALRGLQKKYVAADKKLTNLQ